MKGGKFNMNYFKITLEGDSSGIELICKDVTNVFTKIADGVTNTAGVHKYKDLITGEIIYTGLDFEQSKDKLVGYFKAFISSSDAIRMINSMTYEDKFKYIEHIQSMRDKCSIKNGRTK